MCAEKFVLPNLSKKIEWQNLSGVANLSKILNAKKYLVIKFLVGVLACVTHSSY